MSRLGVVPTLSYHLDTLRQMRRLNLDDLAKGRPHLTAARAGGFAEAAAVMFEANGHSSGVTMTVIDGDTEETFEVTWTATNDAVRRSWADHQEATEHGAYGVSLLLAEALARLTVVERSFKHTGFDYWLGPLGSEDFLFQGKTKLEVSGIGEGESTIGHRVSQKLAQVSKFDPSGTVPAYVAVVDFRKPAAWLVRR